MLRSVVQTTHDYRAQDRQLSSEIRSAAGDLLGLLAAALASYGALLRAESSPGEVSDQQARMLDALSRLRETRDRLSGVLLVDPRSDSPLGLLTSSMLSTVERVLQELSLEDRQRRQVRRPPTLTAPRIPRPHQRHEVPAPPESTPPTGEDAPG